MKTENQFALYFSKEELANSKIKVLIQKFIEEKFNMQRHAPFISVGPAEFELIKKLGEFVEKEKYDNKTEFKDEQGKMRGKRVCVVK